MTVFIAAEAGCNHLGDRSKMLALCDAAKRAGASAVKFQAYNSEALVKRRGKGDLALLKQCELTDDDLDAIAKKCRSLKLKYFWSVFDPSQVARVLDRGACCLKIAHPEADNIKLLKACFEEMESRKPERHLYISESDKFESNRFPGHPPHNVTLVACRAQYPAKGKGALAQMEVQDHHWNNGSSWRRYNGFSSHWTDYRIPAAAALRGAEYIEAHLKLSDTDPEAAWSLSPEDFGKMVKLIREYETWL